MYKEQSRILFNTAALKRAPTRSGSLLWPTTGPRHLPAKNSYRPWLGNNARKVPKKSQVKMDTVY